MKEILYKNKTGINANTIYRTTTAEDRMWILTNVQLILDLDDRIKGSEDSKKINTPTKNLPRQGTGRFNSIRTAADGIITNMVKGSQRNFSSKSCKLIEDMFNEMAKIIPNFETFKWVDAVDVTHPAKEALNNSTGTTMAEIFDLSLWEVDTITLKRKANG